MIVQGRHQELKQSCLHGRLDDMRRLIEGEGISPNAEPEGYPVLYWAARYGQPEIMRYLIAQGADINKQSVGDHRTPLMGAVECADKTAQNRCLILLLKAGADLEARNSGGQTVLMIAAFSDAVPASTIRSLISAGADVFARDLSGHRAIDHTWAGADKWDAEVCLAQEEKRRLGFLYQDALIADAARTLLIKAFEDAVAEDQERTRQKAYDQAKASLKPATTFRFRKGG